MTQSENNQKHVMDDFWDLDKWRVADFEEIGVKDNPEGFKLVQLCGFIIGTGFDFRECVKSVLFAWKEIYPEFATKYRIKLHMDEHLELADQLAEREKNRAINKNPAQFFHNLQNKINEHLRKSQQYADQAEELEGHLHDAFAPWLESAHNYDLHPDDEVTLTQYGLYIQRISHSMDYDWPYPNWKHFKFDGTTEGEGIKE